MRMFDQCVKWMQEGEEEKEEEEEEEEEEEV
jgi:hypothetical protein